MFIYVKGNSAQGMSHAWRGGRAWPTNQAVRVEVLDQDEDPPGEEYRNPDSGVVRAVPDPRRIGRNTFKALREDPTGRVSILSDPETQEGASNAAVDAARAEAGRQAQRAGQLETDLAIARAERDAALKEVTDLRAKVRELESRPAAQPEPRLAEMSRPAGPEARVAAETELSPPAPRAEQHPPSEPEGGGKPAGVGSSAGKGGRK
jgi:hypothetical protein